MKTIHIDDFNSITKLFKECAFHLLFEAKCPLLSLEDMFLEEPNVENKNTLMLHIIMEEGKSDL